MMSDYWRCWVYCAYPSKTSNIFCSTHSFQIWGTSLGYRVLIDPLFSTRTWVSIPPCFDPVHRNPGPAFSIYLSVWPKLTVGEKSGLFLKGMRMLGTLKGQDRTFDILSMTRGWHRRTVALNIIYEGLLLMVLLILMKRQLPLKHIPSSRQEYKNHIRVFMTKMAKIDTLFMTNTAE